MVHAAVLDPATASQPNHPGQGKGSGNTSVQAVCPICECERELMYAGTQRWAEDVARALGQPAATRLYTCTCCGGTFTEATLTE